MTAPPLVAADTVVVLRPSPVVDEYGDTVVDWSSAVSKSYRGSVQPRTTETATANRDGSVSTWVGFIWPATADIKATDRIQFGGLTFEVDGEIQPWSIAGLKDHIEIPLRTWER
jgi:Phage head-tail joining protein